MAIKIRGIRMQPERQFVCIGTNSQNCLVNDLRPRGRARCRSQRIYWPDNEKGLLIVQKTLIKTRCYFYQDAMLFLLKCSHRGAGNENRSREQTQVLQ